MRRDPPPRDPERSPRCTCRYFRTDGRTKNFESGIAFKDPNPRCPICPPQCQAGPVATQRGEKWEIDDPPWR